MILQSILIIAAVFVFAPAAFAQSVTVTPKTTVYRRPKPAREYKKTFKVRRPIVKTLTAALSKKITAAVSPETVLSMNLREEFGEFQWLDDSDYEVIYNQRGLLCIRQWMEGTAAYPDTVSRYVVVDTATGRKLRARDLFTDLRTLAADAKTMQREEVKAANAEIRADPENADVDPDQLFSDTDFQIKDLDAFFIDAKGVTFSYNYGFVHAVAALQPAGEYRFTWPRLKPYIRRDGLLAQFIR